MDIKNYFPVWVKLNDDQKNKIEKAAILRKFSKGDILHNGSSDCSGLILVKSGQLRAYINSEDGREITIYRLFEYDICLFSASCIMNSIQFDITIMAEKDTESIVIPSDIYKSIMEESAPLANYTNEIMASRFSDVMWLIDQIMWKSFDKRLAEFLINESVIDNSDVLNITHEKIGNHLGSPREVVTRMLKYFSNEGMISLSRGKIEIVDKKKLESIYI